MQFTSNEGRSNDAPIHECEKRCLRALKTVPRVEFFENASLSFSCEPSKTMMPYIIQHMLYKGCSRISIVLVFSCGRAKTIRISQRILRIHSEVKKRYCARHGKALESVSISLRDPVPIMRKREGLLNSVERELEDSRCSGMFQSCIWMSRSCFRMPRSCFGISSRYL